ncbi:hypothetical protein [Inquilinus sp. CAU 1745]|uniref:hypothetical protein n=1 Tax=Inquilinus sp. CAU 1745 TaxID=3140369 RepID=UPI00325B82AB
MRTIVKRLVVAAIVGLAAGESAGQDFSLSPAFGSARLAAGFVDDPYLVNVLAGGGIDVSRRITGCTGSIADAPDFRLDYEAGGLPLSIFVESGSDTTLVVNAPDGRWYCDDDGWGDLDPLVSFNAPLSGQYDIWIGQFDGGSGVSATLGISELY